MTYKDYTAIISYDERDKIFHGHLADTYDNVFFEGRSVEALERAFCAAVGLKKRHRVEIGRILARAEIGRAEAMTRRLELCSKSA